MTDYGTIKIPRDAYERHNARRQDLGLSWAAYIDGEAPTDIQQAVREAVREELEAQRR